MNAHEVCIIYTTVGSGKEARVMARQLISQKCIACAHVFPVGQSIYPWEGRVVEEEEVALFLKTKVVLKDEAMLAIQSLHPYECPCILSFDLGTVNEQYLDWLSEVLGV